MKRSLVSTRTVLFSLSAVVAMVACGAYVYLANTSKIKRLGTKDGVARHAWVDGFGRPVMSTSGYSIMETRKTGKGYDDREVRLMDTEGNLIDPRKDTAIKRYRGWREDGWECAEVRYFDKEDKPSQLEKSGLSMSSGMSIGTVLLHERPGWGVLCKEGMGANREVSEETFLGPDGKPIIGKDGYATERTHRRKNAEKGEDFCSYRYFDEKGNPSLHADGYHEERRETTEERDAQGVKRTTSLTRYFGVNGEPCLDQSKGVHEKRETGKSKEEGDLLIETQSFGVSGEPVCGLLLGDPNIRFAKVIHRREGKETTLLFFNEKGQPCPGGFGAEKTVWKKNEQGRIVEILHYHADGRPMNSLIGKVAVERMEYDSKGRQIRSEYVGADGKPAAFNGEVFVAKNEYSMMGGEVFSAHGANGDPVNMKEGKRVFSKVEYVPSLLYWLTDGKSGRMKWSKIIVSDADGKVLETVTGDDVLTFRIAPLPWE